MIRPPTSSWSLDIAGIWRYRDLVALFVKRDLVTAYKQTLLGPLWHVIQPLMMTLIFTFVFGSIAKLSTDGVPHLLFYLSGVVLWRYMSDCLGRTADTFGANAGLFGKVYFPRLTVPIAVVVSSLGTLAVQMALFLTMLAIYWLRGAPVTPGPLVLLFPLLIVQMAALGLGLGLTISSMTARYRDLTHIIPLAVQLWMFATPIVYPASKIPERWQWLRVVNPMTPVVELFRLAFLGVGSVTALGVVIGLSITAAILIAGLVLFSRVEKQFVDSI